MVNLVSIIIPVYNVEKYVGECLESVINQDYPNIEIIVVDDGSPDKAGLICDEYAARDSRITVFHTENGGLSAARNIGIDKCKGDYIYFVDSDDVLEQGTISELVKVAKEENADLVIGKYRFLNQDGTLSDPNERIAVSGKETISEEQFWTYTEKYNSAVVVWSKLYKREIWNEIRFPKGQIHEDHFVLPDVISRCEKIVCIPDYLIRYRKNDVSIMRSKFSFKRLQGIDSAVHVLKYLKSKNNMRAAQGYCQRGMRLIGKAYAEIKMSREERIIFKSYYRLFKEEIGWIHFDDKKASLQLFLFRHCLIIYSFLHRVMEK